MVSVPNYNDGPALSNRAGPQRDQAHNNSRLFRVQLESVGRHPVADFLGAVLKSQDSRRLAVMTTMRVQLRDVSKHVITDAMF